MRDTNLVYTSNKTISAGTYSGILDDGGQRAHGVFVEFVLTGLVGGSPQTGSLLRARLEYSDSATFASGIEKGAEVDITSTFTRLAILSQSKRRYSRVQYSTFGSSPCFTGIYAHIVSGPQRDDVPGANTV